MNSTSPINGKSYKVPVGNDEAGIKNFINENRGKKIVVVQGLGFVGAAMSLVVANSKENYAVIGVDTATSGGYWKIASINGGDLPLVSSDQKVEQYFNQARLQGNFYATYDSYAYTLADVVVVDINLDVEKKSSELKKLDDFSVDLTMFKSAIQSILSRCKEDILMLVETTVPPGTCSKIIKPLVDEIFLKRSFNPTLFKLAHSYERVMPGENYIDSIENFYRVYSGINQKSADSAEEFLRTVIKTSEYPLTRLSNTNATEISKVLENSYRAMNIAFIQEWAELSDAAGTDIYEIISAIKMRPTHNNIMQPGLGVGGYCLTKDPLMASWASKEMFGCRPLGQSEAAVTINDQMPLYSLELLKQRFGDALGSKKVLFLGVSYLNDVGDTRYTPVELLFDELVSLGAEVHLHDPYLSFWEEKKLNVEKKLTAKNIDIIIVSVRHKQFGGDDYFSYINSVKPEYILDTLGCYLGSLEKFREEIHVKIIGRGL